MSGDHGHGHGGGSGYGPAVVAGAIVMIFATIGLLWTLGRLRDEPNRDPQPPASVTSGHYKTIGPSSAPSTPSRPAAGSVDVELIYKKF